MIKRFIIASAILVVLLGGLAYFQLVFKPQAIKTFLASQTPPPATITAEPARAQTWIERLPAIGTLVASQGVEFAPQVSGIVKEISFASGQEVPKGAKLVQLDISVELADLSSAKATLREADVAFQRQQELLEKRVASQANVDTAIAKRDTAEAAVNRIKAVIDEKIILAPFAGRLGIRKVELGQYVSPGQTLVTLQALDPIWVDFPMPEQSIGKLSKGEVIELTTDAFPGRVFKGEVTSLDARVAQDTRTLLVRGTVPNPARTLLPGMFANVAVLAGETTEFVTVPRTAVTYSLHGDSVYIVKPAEPVEGKSPAEEPDRKPALIVERRFVRTGQVREESVEILEGLKVGEQVATTGQIKLDSGARVRIDNSQKLKLPAERPTQ